MSQFAAQLPVDGNGKPASNGNLVGPVIAVTYDATISSATSISLNAATTSFEVLAITQPIFLRFAASVSTSVFDAVIPANQSRVFYRDPAVTTISVLEAAATGLVAVIER
jgi:hypothetical protein